MINRILVLTFILFFIHILPLRSYQFESCCLNEKTINNTYRLLSCPNNNLIKIRSVIFYSGNGCSRSTCQRRLNKHYLYCNNHPTCSISLKCIHMDSSTCPWLTNMNNLSQHINVDYDCVLNKLNFNLNKTKEEQNDNVILFSAKVNIENPIDDTFNDSILIDNELAWKEYFFKKYFHQNKTIIIQHEPRSLLSDILRTVVILIIFAFIVILLMLIGIFLYRRIRYVRKKKFYQQEKHQPFPPDDAYDNLKATVTETASDTGTTTDV